LKSDLTNPEVDDLLDDLGVTENAKRQSDDYST
jgi:hypothetical protein